MKLSIKSISYFLLITTVFAACKKDDHHPGPGPSGSKEEYKFIRVLVADGSSRQLTQISPSDGGTAIFDAAYANATLYPTGSKRFGALLYGTENFVQFFDCGLEYHGDHVDQKGTPKFAAMTSNGAKPTHFKSRHEQTLIFNDGDGTLSLGIESDFHLAGAKMKIIDAGLSPHHGAMAQFDNGTYAVTVKDDASALAGPHGVKIIDVNGHEVFASTMPASRIHGNATDGSNALFGAAGGVLVVKQTGEQRLIANPEGFGDIRLGTILEAGGANKFVGFVATKGAYFIDINNDKITPIAESTDIMQCKIDYAGKHLLILLFDGTLKMYDLESGELKKEGRVTAAVNPSETVKPVLEATTKFAYITIPSMGEVLQVSLTDIAQIKKIKVTAQPARLTILGFETDESH